MTNKSETFFIDNSLSLYYGVGYSAIRRRSEICGRIINDWGTQHLSNVFIVICKITIKTTSPTNQRWNMSKNVFECGHTMIWQQNEDWRGNAAKVDAKSKIKRRRPMTNQMKNDIRNMSEKREKIKIWPLIFWLHGADRTTIIYLATRKDTQTCNIICNVWRRK